MKKHDSLGKEKITYVEFENVVSDVKSIVSNNPDYIYPEYIHCDDCDYPVSYTHLTLPTNREV